MSPCLVLLKPVRLEAKLAAVGEAMFVAHMAVLFMYTGMGLFFTKMKGGG